jgi:hypothetical protein
MPDHECDPPQPPGTTLPPPWRCPACNTLWMAQDDEPMPGEVGDREVPERVTWTWKRFEELTPD